MRVCVESLNWLCTWSTHGSAFLQPCNMKPDDVSDETIAWYTHKIRIYTEQLTLYCIELWSDFKITVLYLRRCSFCDCVSMCGNLTWEIRSEEYLLVQPEIFRCSFTETDHESYTKARRAEIYVVCVWDRETESRKWLTDRNRYTERSNKDDRKS